MSVALEALAVAALLVWACGVAVRVIAGVIDLDLAETWERLDAKFPHRRRRGTETVDYRRQGVRHIRRAPLWPVDAYLYLFMVWRKAARDEPVEVTR